MTEIFGSLSFLNSRAAGNIFISLCAQPDKELNALVLTRINQIGRGDTSTRHGILSLTSNYNNTAW